VGETKIVTTLKIRFSNDIEGFGYCGANEDSASAKIVHVLNSVYTDFIVMIKTKTEPLSSVRNSGDGGS